MAKKTAATDTNDTSWSPNIQADNQTWMFLFMTKEILTSFPDSQSIKMQQMAWWNHAASDAVRQIDAEKKAIEIHRFFRDAMKRPYEAGFATDSFAKAITALTTVLVVADKVIPNLADAVNSIFKFKDES